jgi:hypothetical protein
MPQSLYLFFLRQPVERILDRISVPMISKHTPRDYKTGSLSIWHS